MAPPYRIGKGPIVVALEQFLATGDVVKWYSELSDEATYLTTSEPTEFDKFLEKSDPEGHAHLTQDVFGSGKDAALLPAAEVPAAEQRGLSRRLVYGRGIRRALEIAYGIGGEDRLDDEPWTFDFYWGCGQPFNLVALSTNTAKKVVTVILYSDEVATGDERGTVQRLDGTKPLVPDEDGDLFFVDDREGIGTANEWRATKLIGFASSPDSA